MFPRVPPEWSLVTTAGLAITAFLFCAFLAALIESSAGEIAQAIGNILGAAFGTLGAFGIAYWTLTTERTRQTHERRAILKQIEQDLLKAATDVADIAKSMLDLRLADGVVPDNILAAMRFTKMTYYKDPRIPIHLLTPFDVRCLDKLNEHTSFLRDMRDNARHMEGRQADLWAEMDRYRRSLMQCLRRFVPDARIDFHLLATLQVQRMFPQEGKPFDGLALRAMWDQWSDFVARAD